MAPTICRSWTRFKPWDHVANRKRSDNRDSLSAIHDTSFAVTGRMAAAPKSVGRRSGAKDALVAHPPKNAYAVFQENYLGSIRPGKLADPVVRDRGYLTISVDEIKDIKPMMTVVGGRIVYDAAAEPSAPTTLHASR